MSVSRVLLETDEQDKAYARLREWFKPQPEYAEFVSEDDELGKRLLPQFVQLERRRSGLPEEDVSALAFGAIELLEDAFAKATRQFLDRWGRIYRDFYAAKWKMGDLQGMVAASLAEHLSGRAQCFWSLSLYHYLAEGSLHHLMLALWVASQTGHKRPIERYRRYEEQDPAELISLFIIDDHNWARLMNSLYEQDLRIAFAHVRYQMGRQPNAISLKLGGDDIELDSSALGERVLQLFDGITSLGFGVEAFFLRNHESFDVPSLGLQIDPAQYLNQIQTSMAIRGFRLQVELRKDAANGVEILAILSPVREGLIDADIKQFADAHIGEIMCYLDHYTSFRAENIRLVLTAKDSRPIGQLHYGPGKLKRIRESAPSLVKLGFGPDFN
ncbi:hypothetical protein KAU37_06945 [Candidatus Bipolaricaulota bacterium]|nr:hypothetical protein [Candidatus Bipolaricaulota bacterium]